MGAWKRTRVLAACAVIAAGLAPFAAYHWYFREAEHTRVASPGGRWAVVVTKRMDRFPEPVEVRLKVVQNWESPRVWLDIHLDSPDIWADAQPGSYRVIWASATEFQVYGREPDGAARLRGRQAGEVWVLEPVGMHER